MTQHSLTTLSNSTAHRLTPNGLHSGMDITIQNISDTAYVFVGGEGVTHLNYGFRLAPNQAIAFELAGQDALYAISDTNNSKVAIIKVGLESGY